MDTLKLSEAQRKALEEAGGFEPPKPPEKPLCKEAMVVLGGLFRERVFGTNRMATKRERLMVWSSFAAINWHLWSSNRYGLHRYQDPAA